MSSPSEPQTAEAPRRLWLAAAALAVFHVTLTNYFVPLRGVFSKAPLQGDDYDLHIGQVFRVVEALEGWGKSWLYDVQLLAGQPEGTILDSGSKGWELWTYALHHFGVDRGLAFNLFVALVMLAGPALLYAAARLFDMTPAAGLLAGAMFSTLWFFDSHVHWLWFVGMVSWAGAASLAPVTMGLFYQLVTKHRLALAAPCALCLGAGLLIHPYGFFALAPPMAVLYGRALRTLPRRGHVAVLAIAATALAMNAYWLRNAAMHWHYVLDSAFYAQAGPRFLLCDAFDVLCSGADSGVIGTRTGFRFFYLALAAAGLLGLRRERDPRFLPLFVGIAALYFWAYLGGGVPGLQQTQPYRQITPAAFMTTLPAAGFVEGLFREKRFATLPFGALSLLVVLGLGMVHRLVVGDALYFLPRLIPEPSVLLNGTRSPLSKYGHLWQSNTPSHVHYGVPHERYLESGAAEIIDFLTDHLPPRSRILVEGAMLGERLAWHGRFEVMGGFVERNVAHAYANYFRQYATTVPDGSELARYLHVFAVGFVVSNRPEFAEYPEVLERIAVVAGFHIYRTREDVHRVLAGGGTVQASENRIEVRGSSPGVPIVLSYHYLESLRCKPDCTIERAPVDIDRVGMIQIPAPHAADILIYNGY